MEGSYADFTRLEMTLPRLMQRVRGCSVMSGEVTETTVGLEHG